MEGLGLLKVVSMEDLGVKFQVLEVESIEANTTSNGTFTLSVISNLGVKIKLKTLYKDTEVNREIDELIFELYQVKEKGRVLDYVQNYGITRTTIETRQRMKDMKEGLLEKISEIEAKHNFGKTDMFNK